MAINKIVFFCTSPFTKRDYDRFGGDLLSESGFEVWFYDFSPFIYPKLYKNFNSSDLYQSKNCRIFIYERDGLKAITELPSDSIVIQALWLGSKNFKIYQALSKTKIPYCALANNSFPVGEEKKDYQVLNFIKKFFPLNFNMFKKFMLRPKFAGLWGIRRPDFCMVAGKLSLEKNRNLHRIGNDTEILWTHALDYDIYLKNSEKKFKPTGNHAVFLDPLAPMFQSDAIALGYKSPITVEKFFPSICNFFSQVEKQFSSKVEIAGHPKSKHPSHPDYFEGRRTIIGNTFGMIKESRFVLAHCSTAIQFAILLKKPIIFLTTEEYENDPVFSSHINAFAHSMGKTVINVDKPLTIDWEKELYVDEKIYDDYINRYIKKRGSDEFNSWQILANRLKNF
jgi:hypothetical protein